MHKNQRAHHEDIQYYYEYIANLQKKIVQPMLCMNHGGFINQSSTTTGLNEKFTDVTLRIRFDDIGVFPMVTDIHTHRIILATKSAYFNGLFSEGFQEGSSSSSSMMAAAPIIIPIQMQNHYSDSEIVREFFRLFYMPIFEDSQFSASEYEYIVSNVLALYQLADQFFFHALRKYCKHKIYERFDVSLFSIIYNMCVSRQKKEGDDTKHPLYVIPGKGALFGRLISWFVCCADIQGTNHIPFSELMCSDSTETMNPITQQPNPLIMPPPQKHDDDNRKRKRLSGSSDTKVETLDYMRSAIEDFDAYDLYSFYIRHDHERRATSIRSFGRLCEACVHNKKTVHIARINQVMPDQSRRTWHFYLELAKESNNDNSLFVHVKNSGTTEPLLRCNTRITVLSKLYKNKTQVAIPVISSLASFTNLHQFCINEPEFCYHGECDVCHDSQTRLFIVKYEIDAAFV